MNIIQFLPKGKIWSGKNTIKLFRAIEDSFKRIIDNSNAIMLECFPVTSSYLLKDWCRICGVKDRENVQAVLASTGGNRDEYFINIAKKFDENAFILKQSKADFFIIGKSRCGMHLGAKRKPRFQVTFILPNLTKSVELESILYKSKPSHIEFCYQYKEKIDK